MCHYELDINAFENSWAVDLKAAFPEAWSRLESLAADDLVKLPEDGNAKPMLTVTPEGRYLIRNVAMAFDRYLPPQTTGFSKAI
jgi:oxygen-independent coproporphyrinogen-3 oxidase